MNKSKEDNTQFSPEKELWQDCFVVTTVLWFPCVMLCLNLKKVQRESSSSRGKSFRIRDNFMGTKYWDLIWVKDTK